MLSVDKIAKELGVSKITIFRKLQNGKIRGIKIGAIWRISVEELERIKREGV